MSSNLESALHNLADKYLVRIVLQRKDSQDQLKVDFKHGTQLFELDQAVEAWEKEEAESLKAKAKK